MLPETISPLWMMSPVGSLIVSITSISKSVAGDFAAVTDLAAGLPVKGCCFGDDLNALAACRFFNFLAVFNQQQELWNHTLVVSYPTNSG